MKSAKRNSRQNPNQSTQELRASALRALSGTDLKVVKGGVGSNHPSPHDGGDPIC